MYHNFSFLCLYVSFTVHVSVAWINVVAIVSGVGWWLNLQFCVPCIFYLTLALTSVVCVASLLSPHSRTKNTHALTNGSKPVHNFVT